MISRFEKFPILRRRWISSDCRGIFEQRDSAFQTLQQKREKLGDLEEMDRLASKNLTRAARSNCHAFVRNRGYLKVPTSSEERAFPLAFSILMYKHASQAERLLRAIYAPQNFYCIHVDLKAEKHVRATIEAVSSCFPNIHVIQKSVEVLWGDISVLEAERMCIKYLIKRSHKWRYFINLTGEEFPLWSNRQLVRILRAYNGNNDIDGEINDWFRFRFKFEWINRRWHWYRIKTPPPFRLRIYKGEIHIVATRGFVEATVSDNKKIRQFYDWLKNSYVPDEAFYATLNHNRHVLRIPGGYQSSDPSDIASKGYNARYKVWIMSFLSCRGQWQRLICVLGLGDLRPLLKAPQLFVNKLDITKFPFAFQCVEELQLQRTMDSASPEFTFDTSYYSKLPFTRSKG